MPRSEGLQRDGDAMLAPYRVLDLTDDREDLAGFTATRTKAELHDVAIACASDEQWRALARLIDCAGLAGLSPEQRLRRRRELDARVTAWTERRTGEDVEAALQSLGVPAHPVCNAPEVVRDPNSNTVAISLRWSSRCTGEAWQRCPRFDSPGHRARLAGPGPPSASTCTRFSWACSVTARTGLRTRSRTAYWSRAGVQAGRLKKIRIRKETGA
ncbi:MAG: CoA transferase [Rhodospirillaceae bacterium]|nr:CoA transferase [Rhodospirillaceae bacterium]